MSFATSLPRVNATVTQTKIPPSTVLFPEETLNFWKGIVDVGLMGEVVTNISTELLEMLKGVQLRSEQAAVQDSGGWLYKPRQ